MLVLIPAPAFLELVYRGVILYHAVGPKVIVSLLCYEAEFAGIQYGV